MTGERLGELSAAFAAKQEVWLTRSDLRLLGRSAAVLNHGERISSETGEIRYSAAWLNDETRNSATADESADMVTAEPRCIWAGTWQEKTCRAPACPVHGDSRRELEKLKPLGNVDVLKRDAPGKEAR